MLAGAYGIVWSGVRNFEGKRGSVVLTLGGGRDLALRLFHRSDLRAASSPRYRDGGNCHHLRAAGRSGTLARARPRGLALANHAAPSWPRGGHPGPVFRLPDQRPILIPSM